MTVFEDSLRACIEQEGPITIEVFMEKTVAHYYGSRDPFGVEGDFTTAPEISQIFGELIGAWVADMWDKLERPAPFLLVECGPGRGTLMSDVLRATKGVKGFHEAMTVVMVEQSPPLKEKQKEALKGYDAVWGAGLDDPVITESACPLVILGNEFLDALPIRQVQMTDKGWQEIVVAKDEEGNGFAFAHKEAEKSLTKTLPANSEKYTIFELSPVRDSFVGHVSRLIKDRTGCALFVDYGYEKRSAGDTLQAVKRHEFVPVLSHVGEVDLTSHVDFSAVRSVAEAAGLVVTGVTGQGAFLRRLGIEYRVQALLKKASAEQALEIQAAVDRLCSPAQMGTLFKVIALYSDENLQPAGF